MWKTLLFLALEASLVSVTTCEVNIGDQFNKLADKVFDSISALTNTGSAGDGVKDDTRLHQFKNLIINSEQESELYRKRFRNMYNNTAKCGTNEVYSRSKICKIQFCFQKKRKVLHPILAGAMCQMGCICRDHHLRNNNGTCIPEEECSTANPPTFLKSSADLGACKGDQNAEPGCDSNCTNRCPTLDHVPPTCKCPESSCKCKKGYTYDPLMGKCVLPENCKSVCDINEVFSNCSNKLCVPQNCNERGHYVPCPRNATCVKGCVCREKYLRERSGLCKPEDECQITCPDGEVFSQCPPEICEAEYCPLTRYSPDTCQKGSKCGQPKCFCGYNRRRNRDTGKCVLREKCPPFECNGPNENYVPCPDLCPRDSCLEYLQNSTCSNRTTIQTQIFGCKPRCKCIENYYRNSAGTCVAKDQCYKEACPDGEIYSNYPPTKCGAEFCPQSINYNEMCQTPETFNQGRCICVPNRRRSRTTGKCIAMENCPSLKRT